LTIRWSQRAQSDLGGIFAYISAENEPAAGKVVDRLYAAGQSLGLFPQRGRPARLAGHRELAVDRYLITYRVRREEVLILAVEHGAQRKE
jgi:addiction module RelE/StbE family toxin